MYVTRVTRALSVRALGTLTLGTALVLASGLAGVTAPLVAVAIAAGVAAVVPGVALVCLGLAVRVTFRGLGTCRCAGMMGLGALTAGLTVAVLPAFRTSDRQYVAALGLVVAATLFMLGLLQVPGVACSWLARLRLALDGMAIGSLLGYAASLTVPDPGTHPAAFASVPISATCAAITLVAVMRTSWQRRATVYCGFGAVLAVVGLALLVGNLSSDSPPWAMYVAAALMLSGPPVIWIGARRIDFAPVQAASGSGGEPGGEAGPELPIGLDERFAGYPLLAVPVGLSVLATAYRLITTGLPQQTTVVLAMVAGVMLVAREVLVAIDLRQRARRLAAQEAHLRALVAGTGDVTMVLDEDLTVRWQSPAARQLGLSDDGVVGRRFTELVHPNDVAGVTERLRAVVTGEAVPPVLVEARIIDGAGGWREIETTLSDLRSVPLVGALVVQVRDIGQRRHLERSLHLLAVTDRRTGLPNRPELVRAISARRSAGHRRGSLVVIGLHGLTAVNDLRGRPAGDAVLVEAARRLRAHIGMDDLPARLDESRLAVMTGDGPIEAHALASRLVTALAEPYPLPGRPVHLHVSAGLASLVTAPARTSGHAPDRVAGPAAEYGPAGYGPAVTTDVGEAVLRRGDLALRRASQRGRNQVEWYDESLEEQLVRLLDLERHLPGAAGRGELDLVYQPVIDLMEQRPVGAEALLRWRHAVLGRVLPEELVPVADKLGVISEIGEWVLHTACREAAGWRRDGHDLWLSVNVSARQLADEGFVPGVAAALSVHQTPPERLTIEVSTSEAGIDLPTVASQLGKVRGLGVRTALDHVGAGHTDQAWLRRLPLDMVKLATPPAAELAGGVATAVVDLAGRLGLTVVAQGLETTAQRELVEAAGCRYGQGYLVSPPAPAERIEAYLDSATRPTADVELPSPGSS